MRAPADLLRRARARARAERQHGLDGAEARLHAQVLLTAFERRITPETAAVLCDTLDALFPAGARLDPTRLAALGERDANGRLVRMRLIAKRAKAYDPRQGRRLLAVVTALRKALAPPRAKRKPPKQQELFA